MSRTAPALSGPVERAAYRASIPALGAKPTAANYAAHADVRRYRVARATGIIRSH